MFNFLKIEILSNSHFIYIYYNYKGLMESQQQYSTTDSLKESLRVANETQELGIHTLGKLQEQGEQLDHMLEKTDAINSSLDVAKYNLRSIKSLFGQLSNVFRTSPEVNHIPSHHMSNKQVSTSNTTVSTIPRTIGNQLVDNNLEEKEDDEDQLLNELAVNISNLKEIAQTMGSEIDCHSQKIDDLHSSADHLQHRINGLQGEIRRIL